MSKSEILSQVPDKVPTYDAHIDDHENPHGTTADQVGAYTKGESDDLLDDKFDKSGGTIEGVTIIETDSPDGLEIVRTGTNAGRARLRIVGTGNSGLAPELIITGDLTSETPGLPVYIPGRISTRDGFYIGSTRKDQEWDAKTDQTAGTWPMQITGTEGGSVLPFGADFYRIGDLVNVRGTVTTPFGDAEEIEGDFIISGLQYSGMNNDQMGELRHSGNVVYPAGASHTMVNISTSFPGSLDMYFIGPAGYVRINPNDLSAGTVWRFNITYTTNDPF